MASYLSELNQQLLPWTHPEHHVSDSTRKNKSCSITVANNNSRRQRRDSPAEHLFIGIPKGRRYFDVSVCKGQTCWRVGITTSVRRRFPPTPSMHALHKRKPVFAQHMASIGGLPTPPPLPLLLCLQLRRRRRKKQAGDSQLTQL